MASRGAPKGNTNASNGTMFKDALHYALTNYADDQVEKGHALKEVAKTVVKKAVEGEQWAVQEIGNRLDGKPKQQTELSSNPDAPVGITVIVSERPTDPA